MLPAGAARGAPGRPAVDWIAQPEAWIALATLTVMEIVLGIDNIIFISILTGDLPPEQRRRARSLGLALAMASRIALLFSLTLIMKLTAPLFTVPFTEVEISGRDLVLILGGLFLLVKSTLEIHRKIEVHEEHHHHARRASFANVLVQIALLDIVFSLDSVITAIGMADQIAVMVIAVVIAVIFMMVFVNAVSNFVDRHPTVKVLALSFLLLIGVALVAEGLDLHMPKGYIYFAMAFSAFVEGINLKVRSAAAKRR
jgi:predicted tellurium resistance membrane protein TerC